MSSNDLNRRDFHQLTMAAVGGLMAGTFVGCDPAKKTDGPAPATPPATPAPGAETPAEAEQTSLLMQEKHVCRGLNMCKNQGVSGENTCAGQGTCATYALHECAQQNECKGQGGCGTNAGENACKAQGGCHLPLMDHAWESARKRFEEAMKKSGKEVGVAPPKA
ncbi:twin-arginine translocation signal domain-containing protein [Planctomicrobium sp. SH668]|uniref:twin-arginine translocation signal domain-containing protein n=1 Tax=Planctomicrobium sp. SH668 TaxID=3448126 RepID=UPI003F5BF8C8